VSKIGFIVTVLTASASGLWLAHFGYALRERARSEKASWPWFELVALLASTAFVVQDIIKYTPCP
jgi:hypothetical protein